MLRTVLILTAVTLLSACIVVKAPPGQVKKQTAPGQVQKATGVNPASGKVKK